MIPGHRSEIRAPTGVQGNEGDKLDFRVWPDENGLLGRYALTTNKLICFMKMQHGMGILKKVRTIYNCKHCIAVDLISKHNQKGTMLGRVNMYLFIQLTWSDWVTSHEEMSWPLTLRQEIPNIHIFNSV
jgi:hypothetical protein